MPKFKYIFFSVILIFFAQNTSVYAAERAYRTVLSIPNQGDISLHVFTPPNTPKGVLIALHGCGGLLSTNTSQGDRLSARHAAMAKFANDLDWIAVFPDSFSNRGRREICTQKFSERTIKQADRKNDALATARWVREQNWVNDSNKSTSPSSLKSVLLGWSNGGTTVLQTIESRSPAEAFIDQAVAFYPGCSQQLARDFRTRIPLTLFIGGQDDWTPPKPCIALGERIGASVFVYPDAHHGFDSPVGKVRLRKDVPNGVHPGEGVHVGPHPASREDAYAKLATLLRQLSVSVR
ncbi:dienelactone hydrolase family protein [Zwartia vadi]|uniref:dienelactone hydrolase family protein n=1 Tax=Zwartia vadi TaxID=3058168 RepID=UPI0025B53B29|nr:dienelactone hydrolase family protein [Zwartia vadi]MDN3987243.1 dienelactone hydrolase family protein [Zwartia vadi]